MSLLAVAVVVAFAVTMAGIMSLYSTVTSDADVAAVEAAVVVVEPMTAGEAARMVREASPAAFGHCFEAVGNAGWPTSPDPAEEAVARRQAMAECLRGN